MIEKILEQYESDFILGARNLAFPKVKECSIKEYISEWRNFKQQIKQEREELVNLLAKHENPVVQYKLIKIIAVR